MKKKGDNWNKFKDLEKDILSVLKKNNSNTISLIKSDLENKGVKVSWVTIRNYLNTLDKKKKVNKNIIRRYTFWSKR